MVPNIRSGGDMETQNIFQRQTKSLWPKAYIVCRLERYLFRESALSNVFRLARTGGAVNDVLVG